jgi:hypothetical protein
MIFYKDLGLNNSLYPDEPKVGYSFLDFTR